MSWPSPVVSVDVDVRNLFSTGHPTEDFHADVKPILVFYEPLVRLGQRVESIFGPISSTFKVPQDCKISHETGPEIPTKPWSLFKSNRSISVYLDIVFKYIATVHNTLSTSHANFSMTHISPSKEDSSIQMFERLSNQELLKVFQSLDLLDMLDKIKTKDFPRSSCSLGSREAAGELPPLLLCIRYYE